MVATGSSVIQRLVHATNNRDLDAMVECFHDDYRSEQPFHPEAGFGGRDQVRKNWSLMFEEIPDIKLKALRTVTVGDESWSEWHIHGRKRDGTPFEYRGMGVFGIRHDRIAWARLYFEPVEVGGAGIDERMHASSAKGLSCFHAGLRGVGLLGPGMINLGGRSLQARGCGRASPPVEETEPFYELRTKKPER
jgi:hypothetical protein